MDRFRRDAIFSKSQGSPPADAHDTMYLRETQLQCGFALRAYGDIQSHVNSGSQDVAILALAHMLLVFASNVAKLLFPGPKAPATAKTRADRLRTKIGIASVPPTIMIDARNYLEHFDERMDRFLTNHQGLLFHRGVVPKASEEIELDDGRRFRPKFLQLFETQTMELTLYDQVIKISDLVQEITAIQIAVSAVIEQAKSSAAKGGD